MLYHAQVDLFAGGYLGVDVFFVLSGFLITRSLVNEAGRSGGINLASFYARRARRLVPAGALVLAATAVAVWRLLPVTSWRTFGGDIAGAAGFVANWRFVQRSVDYLAEGIDASPVQHFWSLSIEEQFYFVWPALIILALWIARRRGWSVARTVAVVLLVVVVVPSFWTSLTMTESAQPRAFFHTGTRMWELGAGALCAMARPSMPRLSRWLAVVLKGASLATIIGVSMVIDDGAAWPGWLAMTAVVPTALLVLLGSRETDVVDRVLSVRPMQLVGSWSYSLYLWHWPPLAVLAARWGELTTTQACVIVLLSIVPAVLSYYLVENPVRYSATLKPSSRLSLSLGANLTLAGVAAGLALIVAIPRALPAVASPSPAVSPSEGSTTSGPIGAAALTPGASDEELLATLEGVTAMTPMPADATADIPQTYPDGCHVRQIDDTEPVVCEYGPADADVTIALVGDSKAGHWATPLIDIAMDNGWLALNITKSACELSATMPDRGGDPDPDCLDWGRQVVELLTQDPPDLVLVSQGSGTSWSDDPGADTRELMVRGMAEAYRPLAEAGSRVAILLDNPSPNGDVYECVAENPTRLEACTFEKGDQGSRVAQRRVAAQEGYALISMDSQICPTPTCLPVIGGVLVYRQGSHLTATYAQSTRPWFEQQLREVLEVW